MRRLRLPILAATITAVILAGGCGKELPSSSGPTEGYDRIVLAELFTTVWCGWCPTAEEAMDRLFDEEGPTRLAVIHWHSSYGQGDPFAIPEADARAAEYGTFLGDPPGFPTCVYDGIAGIRGGWEGLYDSYRERYESEAALASQMQISLDAEVSGNSATVEVAVATLPEMPSAQFDLVVVAVEHHAIEGTHTTSYVARNAATQTVTLLAGQDEFWNITLPLDPSWKREDLYLVAFLQEQQPSAGRDSREVLQAAMSPLVTEQEDFYGFFLSAPDTTIGIAVAGERLIPFSIQNTGTLRDSLTIDLPSELNSLPDDQGWSASLTYQNGEEISVPVAIPVEAGALISTLRVKVSAATEDSGRVALVVSSAGDAMLADTLSFFVKAGVYGLDLRADETEIDVLVDTPALAPFEIENTGTIEDSVVIDLPDSLSAIPEGWKVSLCDEWGTVIAVPHAHHMDEGSSETGLRIRITAVTEGTATIGLVVSSRGDPALTETLVFSVESRAYNFDLSADETSLQIVVGTPATAPFEITNTGSRDDLLRIDLPEESQSLPGDWSVSLTYGDGIEIQTPHLLLLEQGNTAGGFGVRISAASGGTGAVRLVATSTGDPSLSDTLVFSVTADQYGFELSAPAGTDVVLEPDEPTLVPFTIENTGTLDDTLIIDLPEDGVIVPEGWEVFLADEGGTEIGIPHSIPLVTGTETTDLRIRVLAPESGSGTVELVVSSTGLPALGDTLVFSLSASPYGFELSAPETEIYIEEYPTYAEAHFVLVNTGTVEDELNLALPPNLQSVPPTWDIPIICEEGGVCYGPYYSLTVAAGETIDHLVVDIHVTGAGTGYAKLIVTSTGNPSLADTLDLMFTTEPRARWNR